MKIVYIIGGMFQGGAESLVYNLCIKFSKIYDVSLWLLKKKQDSVLEMDRIALLKKCGVKIIYFYKRDKKDRIKTIIKMRKLIRSDKPEIVHAHLSHIAILTSIAAYNLDAKIIMTAHNTHLSADLFTKFVLKGFVKYFIGVSDQVSSQIEIIWGIDKKNIKTIKNAIDLEKFFYPERKINKVVKKIVSVGRLVEQKDHLTLLAAYKQMINYIQQRGDVCPTMDIIGEGHLYNKLQNEIKILELESYVHILGTQKNMHILLRDYDMFVLASSWEGYPMVLLEAMASGIPIIATNVGGVSDIIWGNIDGILISKGNPTLLCDTMINLSEDLIKRETLSLEALKKSKMFGLDRLIDEHKIYYKNIMI